MIINTAPHALEQAAAAATAVDLVIIPTRAGVMDIEAIDATVDIVNGVNAAGVIVINAPRPRGTMTDEARQALTIYELPICPTAIVQRAALAEGAINATSRLRTRKVTPEWASVRVEQEEPPLPPHRRRPSWRACPALRSRQRQAISVPPHPQPCRRGTGRSVFLRSEGPLHLEQRAIAGDRRPVHNPEFRRLVC